MDKKKKQEGIQPIEDEALDQVTGGANFDRYIGYSSTCNNCGHKWETASYKPKKCPKCGEPYANSGGLIQCKKCGNVFLPK